jgi:hypothetical protein
MKRKIRYYIFGNSSAKGNPFGISKYLVYALRTNSFIRFKDLIE